MKQGSSEVCTGELTGNLVEQASATTGVYREREVRLHAWIFPNILSSLLPFLPPPSPLPHCGISLFSNVPISLFTGDFASHPQPWDFFFFFFYKSCSQSTFWNTSSKGLIWLRLSLSYDQEKSGVSFMFSWWKAKGWAVPWKVIRPFQEARSGWGREGRRASPSMVHKPETCDLLCYYSYQLLGRDADSGPVISLLNSLRSVLAGSTGGHK